MGSKEDLLHKMVRLKKDFPEARRFTGQHSNSGPVFETHPYKAGQIVKVVMTSRLGDIGITDSLDATYGYDLRIFPEDVEVVREDVAGKWETSLDDDKAMIRVRWSIPLANGMFFYCRHYPGSEWGIAAAESEAKAWNQSGKRPEEFRDYRDAVLMAIR